VNEMTDHTIVIAVPADALAELEHDGLADPLPRFRGAALDAIVTVGTDAAALVTLLQTPDSLRAFAGWVRGRCVRSGASIDVSIKRGNHRVHLAVDGDVDVKVVAEFLAAAFTESE
jgi:hypothetical protein